MSPLSKPLHALMLEEDAKFQEFIIYSTILKKSARPRMSLRWSIDTNYFTNLNSEREDHAIVHDPCDHL